MTITGTNHFTSFAAALSYYRQESPSLRTHELRDYVQRKFDEREIQVGKPALREGERLGTCDNGARYTITTD